MSAEVEQLRAQVAELRRQLHWAQDNNHRRNVELDGLHYVWCTGGCPGGVHRYHREPLTEETVILAELNVKRLRSWWNSRVAREENGLMHRGFDRQEIVRLPPVAAPVSEETVTPPVSMSDK